MNQLGRGFRSIPPVTLNLLIINAIVWVAELVLGKMHPNVVVDFLGLHFWGSQLFNPFQIVSYMFVHDPHSILHILFNMFTLWMFGRFLEQVWGSRRFLFYYLLCGVGAALIQEGVWQITYLNDYISGIADANHLSYGAMEAEYMANPQFFAPGVQMFKNALVTVGASGAVFGLLLGFAFVFPDMPLYLFFVPVPIKAKYMVVGYAVLEFFLGVVPGIGGPIAHFAHLGGMLVGLIVLLIWKKQGRLGGRIF